MQKHTIVYFKHFKIDFDSQSGWHDHIKCEICGKKSTDIHHINGRWAKGKLGEDSNDIRNLIALCRSCHEDAHNGVLSKGDLHVAHNSNLY